MVNPVVQQEQEQNNQCPEGCCTGNEILCLSIPCPVTIVLLGITLQLELPCLRLTSPTALSPDQASQLLQVLTNLINSIVGNLGVGGISAEAKEE